MINPFACFDCLSIGRRTQLALNNFAQTELHLFAYLACLLSVYKQRPVTEWGYSFYGTRSGIPFSPEIDSAISELTIAGLFDANGEYLKVTGYGQEEYELLRGLSQNSIRESFIEGACSSILALPIGTIRDALSKEPEIGYAIRVQATRRLLEDGPGLELLYSHFASLSNAIGVEVDDLMLPAVLWLTYLSQVAKTSLVV
jgi:hypothetical protein